MLAVIANPSAGRGKVRRKLKDVLNIIEEFGFDYELFLTEKPGDATAFAELVRKSTKFEKVLVLGGDGTLNETIQSLVNSEKPVLPIPLGTGNDFVKFFYPFRKYDTILNEYLNSDQVVEVDVGVVEAQGFRRYFINGMGIGFDSEVLNVMKKIRFLKGDFLYTASVLKTFLSFKGMELEAIFDGGKGFLSGKFLLFNVGNGHYLGGGFRLFPLAKVNDGLLDVSIIDTLGPLRFFTNFYKAYKGRHIVLKEVHYSKAKEILVKGNEPFNFQLDGELVQDMKEIKISVLKNALRVVR